MSCIRYPFLVNESMVVRCFFFTCVVALLTMSSASSEPLRIDTIRVAPFGFVTDDGTSTGFLYELSNRLAEEAGLSSTNQIVPFATMLNRLKEGNSDVSLFFRSATNDPLVVPVSSLLSLTNVIRGRKGSTFDSLDSLHGKTVARVRGARYDEAFNQDAAISKRDSQNYQESIQLLREHRVDAVILPDIGFLYTIKRLGYPLEEFGEPFILNSDELWIQYSKVSADADRIAALKAAAEGLLQDGSVQMLLKKYVAE